VAPAGGEPRQITRNPKGVASAFSWSPDGRWIAHVMDGSVCVTDVARGATSRLTLRADDESAPLALACVFSPDGRRIAYQRKVRGAGGVLPQIFVVDAEP
jgi:Tol biopolymer transport system component